MSTQGWEKIGKIGKARGLDGSFYIGGRCSLLPPIYQEVTIGPEAGRETSRRIVSYQVHNGRVLLKLAGLENRSALEPHLGKDLWALKPKDSLSYEHLLGVPVYDESGLLLGTVSAFYNHGASDTVEIQALQGEASLEVPFVADYFELDELARAAQLRMRVPAEFFADLWFSKEGS